MPYLVEAYLEWQGSPLTAHSVNSDDLPEDIVSLPERPQAQEDENSEGGKDDESPLVSDAPPGERDFLMQGVDTFGEPIYLYCFVSHLLTQLYL